MPAQGYLVGNRVCIWDREEARRLYKEGFYGKPLGIPKPKGADFDAPLLLDLLEAYYLCKKGRLYILDIRSGRPVSLEGLRRRCVREYVEFAEKYMVYEHLRERGFVVTPGIKFGCDFAVYEQGPGIDHAPYLIQVFRPSAEITAPHIVLAGRLANTVRKKYIMALADRRRKKISLLGFEWWRA
ncbi:MAG: tRNA-intron lyase [Nitrososphaerota archaeon]